MPGPDLESSFPGLRGTSFEITSPQTPEYNCIAWAASDTANWWTPDPFNQYFWPPNAPRGYSLPSYLRAFELMGYTPCNNADLEAGLEKVVIYEGRDGFPSHMARQLPNGKWTSKLGASFDISHEGPLQLEGDVYGKVLTFLRRPTQG